MKYFQIMVHACDYTVLYDKGSICLNIPYVIQRLMSLGIGTPLEDANIPIHKQETAHVMFIEGDAC